MNLRLLVTADDFGFSLPVSRGIVHAHLHGPVRSTSVMVLTGEHLQQSLHLLNDAPHLELGLHFMLTHAGHPPLVATRASGLVNSAGNFHNLRDLFMQTVTGRVDRNAVYDELAAQIDRFRTVIGRPPAYLDGHHHVHQLPLIRDVIAEAVSDRLAPPILRLTWEPPRLWRIPGARFKRWVADRLANASRGVFERSGAVLPTGYFGMLAPEHLSRPFPWQPHIDSMVSHGVVEWVVHPGEFDEHLASRDNYVKQRQIELDALCRREHWQHLQPNLCTHAQALG